MSTPNRNLKSVQEKEAIAQEYSDKVKALARRFNIDTQRLLKAYFPLIQRAVSQGYSVDSIIDSLAAEIETLMDELINKSITFAIEREEEDKDICLPLIASLVPECSLDYYLEALEKYKRILKEEIDLAVEMGYTNDLIIFLSNPQGYASGKKGGLLALKEGVSEVSSGVSYSLGENLRKIGISISALVLTNAIFWLWGRNGEIIGYYGKRNSNYPCPYCDDHAYIFYPMSMGMIYPLHNRCVCAVIPLRLNEILL